MMYDLGIEEQRKQFCKVLDYLTSIGHTQKDIAAKIGSDYVSLSHLRSGKIKNIPSELVDNLHEEFDINPEFIYSGSDYMIDIPGLKLTNFEHFVDKWDIVDHDPKPYVRFSINENFYNFLLEVYAQKEISIATEAECKKTCTKKECSKNKCNKATTMFSEALKTLKKSYSDNGISKEYLLIPTDLTPEITEAHTRKRKNLHEVMDLLNFKL